MNRHDTSTPPDAFHADLMASFGTADTLPAGRRATWTAVAILAALVALTLVLLTSGAGSSQAPAAHPAATAPQLEVLLTVHGRPGAVIHYQLSEHGAPDPLSTATMGPTGDWNYAGTLPADSIGLAMVIIAAPGRGVDASQYCNIAVAGHSVSNEVNPWISMCSANVGSQTVIR